VSVAELIKLLKGASSHDMNQQQPSEHFAWQRGYGVFTIGQRQRADAEAYVKGQKEHHSSQNEIAWLETCTEDDDGPTDHTDHPLQPVPALRDERPQYVVASEQPAF